MADAAVFANRAGTVKAKKEGSVLTAQIRHFIAKGALDTCCTEWSIACECINVI